MMHPHKSWFLVQLPTEAVLWSSLWRLHTLSVSSGESLVGFPLWHVGQREKGGTVLRLQCKFLQHHIGFLHGAMVAYK